MQNAYCPNTNHSCTNAPVRFCPMYGDVVNGNMPTKKCGENPSGFAGGGGNKSPYNRITLRRCTA